MSNTPVKDNYIETLKKIHKYNKKIINYLETESVHKKSPLQILRNIKKFYQKEIPNSVIISFYEDPKSFFANYKTLLLNTSLFDISGHSIFVHYFNVLNNNNTNPNNNNYYENYFSAFIGDFREYLYIQDDILDTPLHKLVKQRNKKLFLKIFKKLFDLGFEDLLYIKNEKNEDCFNIMINYILNNKRKILNEFELYSNFLKITNIKIQELPKEKQLEIKLFLSKVFIDENNYQKINIVETIEKLNNLLKSLENENIKDIFTFLFEPISDINHLNLIYDKCTKIEEFNKLFDFIINLSNIEINNYYNNKSDLHSICIMHHINHVMKNMGNNPKLKGENDINYGFKLLSEVINLLLEKNKSEHVLNLIYEKKIWKTPYENSIYNNKGIISNLMNNYAINLNKKIDIYQTYLIKYNQKNLEFIESKSTDKEYLLLNLIINKDNIINNTQNNFELEKFKKIFDDFYFVGLIYLELYILSEKYKTFTQEYSIKQFNEFLIKNNSDLFSQYKILYGLTNDKLNILIDFIIKHEKKYVEEFGNDLIQGSDNYNDIIGKNTNLFDIWYSKFIITEPNILKSFLIDIDLNKPKFEKINSPLLKEKSKKLTTYYNKKIILTFLRLLLLLKYNLEEIANNPSIVTLFGNDIGNNYLINHKNDIKNSLASMENDAIISLVKNCKENPDAFILFLDEKKIVDEIYLKEIKYSINSLMKISDDTKALITISNKDEIENFYDYIDINIEKVNNLYKFLSHLKKQKTSLTICSKNNLVFFQSLFYLIVKYYNYSSTSRETRNINLQKEIDLFFDEINEFLTIYHKEKYESNEIFLSSLFKIISNNFYNFSFWEKTFLPHISIIKQKILNNNYIDFSHIEKAINTNIFFFCYLLMNGEGEIKKEEDIEYIEYIDFSNCDKYIIKFFFEYFLALINPNLSKKYYNIYLLLNSFIKMNNPINKRIEANDSLFKYICNEKYYINNFGYVLLYIFLKKKYPNYNNFLLFYFYRILAEKEPKIIYWLLIKIFDPKSNIKNIEQNLFLIKNEEIPKQFYEKMKFVIKGKNVDYLIANELFKIFMNNYLINLEYNKDSFVRLYIEKYAIDEKNINIIKNIVLNDSFYNNNEIIIKYMKNFSPYEILISEKKDENLINKKIKILESLIQNISKENTLNISLNNEWQNNIESNWFFGLYNLLKYLKKSNKNLFALMNKNIGIIFDTIITLCNFRKCLLYQKIKNESQDKIDFVLNEIHEILYAFISSQHFKFILSQKFEDENQNEKIKTIIEKNVYDLFKYYTKIFYEEMLNIKTNRVKLNSNFDQFQSILGNILSTDINELVSLKHLNQIIIYLFHKDTDKFYTLLNILKNEFCNANELYINNLMISLMKKNAEKFFKNLPKIKTFIKVGDDWYNQKGQLEVIIAHILNNSIPAIYSKLDFVINSSVFNSIDRLYNLLSKIKNKEASLFILNTIENKFNKKNNVEKLLDIMERVIYNEYIISHLFNSLNENDKKELIKSGKYINSIIKSLFKFSEINGYLFLKNIFSLISQYSPKFDFKSLILPPSQEPYKNMVEINQIINPILPLENSENEDITDETDKKMIYLLYYALRHRMRNNYEFIAILMEYIELNDSGQFLIEELVGNIDNLLFKENNEIKHLEFFLNGINDKNIKELGNKLYSFIAFIDSIIKEKQIINNFTDIEKYICVNYIKIFLLEIFPNDLEIFFENDKETNDYTEIQNKKNNKNMTLCNNEDKLLSILTLYQIKGNQLLDIKNTFPTFYSKIETFINNKCKALNINAISLKKESDINKFNKIKNIFLNDNNFFILWRYPFNLCPNFMKLIKVKKSPNVNDEYILANEFSIETLVDKLLKGIDVKPIYMTNDTDLFMSCSYEMRYKPIIDSLNDFKKSSLYIINLKGKSNNKANDIKIVEVYILYLEYILGICKYITEKYNNNNNSNYKVNLFLEKLSKSDEDKLNLIKNSIEIKEISLAILKKYEQENPNLSELYNALKLWMIDYLNKNASMKILDKLSKEPLNILSYFKYLELSCFIIYHFIETFEKYKQKKQWQYPEEIIYEKYYMYKKNIPKKEMNEKYNKIGNILEELFKYENPNLKVLRDVIRYLNDKGGKFPLYYYFNEEKEIFIEIFTDEFPYKYEKENFVFDYINNYLTETNFDINKNTIDIDKDKLAQNKIKNKLYIKLVNLVYSSGIDINKKNINYFLNLFEPVYNKYNNYLNSFFTNIVNTKIYKSYFDFENEIINEFKNNFILNIFPSVKFSQDLYIFLNNFSCFQKNINIGQDIFVDFSELIKSINDTKYHSNEKLDKKFKINAINYIINTNSNINYFIKYLYSIIYDKINKSETANKNIKEFFTIKIQQGNKKLDIYDAKKILYSIPIENSFKTKDKNFLSGKSKFYYSIVTKNIFKRKKVPIVSYSGYIPLKLNSCSKRIEDDINHAFLNNTMTLDKNAFMKNINPKKKKKGKEYINVYELMYAVKSVENNVIVLEKNDVGKILKNYSENDEVFLEFINASFSERKNEKFFIDWDKIKFNWKYN